jgi:hypothetical protein
MTSERDHAMIRESLAPFLADAIAGLDLEIQRRSGRPDLQEAVVRAHGHAPELVTDAFVAASRDVGLLPDEAEETAAPESAEFSGFLADAAAHIESWSADRRLAAVPELPRRRRGVAVVAIVAGVLATAAAILLVVRAMVAPDLVVDREADGAEAPMSSVPADRTGGHAERRAPRAVRRVSPVSPPTPASDSVPPPALEVVTPPPEVRRHGGPHPQVEPVARESLEELDARAQARWRAGDVAEAEKLLEEIVRRGGKSKYAELAFGDLFTLAHRDSGSRRQSQLWRRYLARFPKGRYADDARGSLCRLSGELSCWADYLHDWPRGAHRAEAKRHTAGP